MGVTDKSGTPETEVLPGLTYEALRGYLAGYLDASGSLALDSVRVAGQGMSDDTILVDATAGGGKKHSLVLRRYRHDGVARELSDPARHYRTLKALEGTSIPAPRALWFDPVGADLGGACFAMERLEGFVPVPWSPSGREFLHKAGEGPLGLRFASLLADIHAVDWARLALDTGAPATSQERCARQLHILETMLNRYRSGPEPVLADALGWLKAHAATVPEETVLVHGDYRTGNLLFSGEEVTGVLDWEFAQLGDPMRDVAWVLAASNRVGSDLACYILPPDRFVALYEQYSGRRVNWPAIRYWQVYHQLFNALGWLHAGHNIKSGKTADLRMLRWSYTMPVMRRFVIHALKEAS